MLPPPRMARRVPPLTGTSRRCCGGCGRYSQPTPRAVINPPMNPQRLPPPNTAVDSLTIRAGLRCNLVRQLTLSPIPPAAHSPGSVVPVAAPRGAWYDVIMVRTWYGLRSPRGSTD